MRSRRLATAPAAGFTIIELAIVIAIIGIIAAIAGSYMSRSTTRANLANATTELQALLHQARQSALATGNPVGVLLYTSYSPPAALGSPSSIGYVIVYQDACFDFFTGGGTCGIGYGSYNPAVLATGGNSVVLDTLTLPYGVLVGPATGIGSSAVLAAPLNNVPVNTACSFCGTTGGAVQFDPRGQATFYALSGSTVTGPLTPTTTPTVNGGASLSLGYNPAVTDATGQRTLVILSGSGAVQALNGG